MYINAHDIISRHYLTTWVSSLQPKKMPIPFFKEGKHHGPWQ